MAADEKKFVPTSKDQLSHRQSSSDRQDHDKKRLEELFRNAHRSSHAVPSTSNAIDELFKKARFVPPKEFNAAKTEQQVNSKAPNNQAIFHGVNVLFEVNAPHNQHTACWEKDRVKSQRKTAETAISGKQITVEELFKVAR
ncbi:unnamed protein product [Caenorhabditis bovis]|uniref:Uncharacterized protein n=1 Tax=Caenorhabditis bovis TaxID=2654633 RepID=A0A8S1F3S3_9PELO|nr:unnamed protein product [Caenorhabditis bovis]